MFILFLIHTKYLMNIMDNKFTWLQVWIKDILISGRSGIPKHHSQWLLHLLISTHMYQYTLLSYVPVHTPVTCASLPSLIIFFSFARWHNSCVGIHGPCWLIWSSSVLAWEVGSNLFSGVCVCICWKLWAGQEWAACMHTATSGEGHVHTCMPTRNIPTGICINTHTYAGSIAYPCFCG